MQDTLRTLLFVVVAGATLAAAGAAVWLRSPALVTSESLDDTGERFFEEFEATKVASLEIVAVDEDTKQFHEFRVAKKQGQWTIPSRFEYPADAQRQVEEAAASVVDLTKLNIASDSPVDHELYGVLDPDPSQLESGQSGFGMRVTLADAAGSKLAQFILGKQDPDQTSIRFVRVPGQDRVYRCKVDTSKLTTKFEDWIEKDLLKLSPYDVRRVILSNYSVDEARGVATEPDIVKLTYHDQDAKWTMEDAPEGRELNAQKLNDLKSALDTLKIVDVRRKPAGLSRQLRFEKEGVSQQEAAIAVMSLQEHGFFVGREGGLLSNEGEVIVGTADGLEYVMRFGALASGVGGDAGADDAAAADEEGAADDELAAGEDEEGAAAEQPPAATRGSNRYIMLTVEFRPEYVTKPTGLGDVDPAAVFEEVKQEIEDAKKPRQPAADDGDAEDAADDGAAGAHDDEPADEGTEDAEEDGDQDAPAAEESEDAADADDADEPVAPARAEGGGAEGDEAAADDAAANADTAAEPEGDEPAASDDEDAGSDPAPADDGETTTADDEADATTDEPPADGEATEPADGDSAEPADGAETPAATALTEEERTRKLGEYKDKIKRGWEKTQQLNDRFADWFYVIADAEYKKIRLTRKDVLKAVDQPLDTTGLDDTDDLRELPAEDGAGDEEQEPAATDDGATTDDGDVPAPPGDDVPSDAGEPTEGDADDEGAADDQVGTDDASGAEEDPADDAEVPDER
jgi:hypothetical protein